MYNDYWVILQAFKFFHLPVTSYCFKKIVKTNWFFIICWIPLLYYILKDNTYIYVYPKFLWIKKKKKKYSIIITIFLWDQNILSFPAILLMTAMWPSFLSNIWGSTCLVRERTPRTFSSITSLSISKEVSSNKARWDRPALFTRMSI